ncbi:MAG: DUF3576 domain-containing protein [Pseudomonadota bacterium]
MRFQSWSGCATVLVACLALAGCGSRLGNIFSGGSERAAELPETRPTGAGGRLADETEIARRGTIWDIFGNRDDPNTTLAVNRYIWNASLEVLDFMPIQSVDPFSGVIVYGFGAPPGSGRAYRATVFVQDPALDARSLRVALATRSGPASAETVRAIEDAILTRARQLRIAEERL